MNPTLSRRTILSASAAMLFAPSLYAQGKVVPDMKPVQISPHVWSIYTPHGEPTPENHGMISNVTFVVTRAGVVVLDTGGSLQIGRMAIRQIKKVSNQPVIALINTHFHGDHWLGNHAFIEEYGNKLPIYALAEATQFIQSEEGQQWVGLMARWTNQSTVGTQAIIPNAEVKNGQTLLFGDVRLKMHFYGRAHTSADLSVEVVEDKLTFIGDIAMTDRIGTFDEGSYPGTLRYFSELKKNTGNQLWLPAHGVAARDLLDTYGAFMAGIWENCLKAVKDGKSEGEAKTMVLADPRVAMRAKTMQGFHNGIGKYISLAYLEAEKEAF
ncbi:MAG: hypothetical protein RIR79_434 [Pseudomonadota bacterium]|jgi:glyoxylase-like metal-dependent hydrolase (beta-lactamase superfamily II)